MKLALVGVGSAGARIVDRILELEVESGRNISNGNALVFDTAQAAFADLEYVPEENRAVFGDIYPRVEANGEDGTDGDPDLGVEVAREDIHELRRAFDVLEFTDVDATLLVAGLGGGTGGGAGAVLLEELQSVDEKPVYALGVLPADAESDQAALNAARSLQSFVTIADNTICFDNEAWRPSIRASESSTESPGSTDATRTDTTEADGSDGDADDGDATETNEDAAAAEEFEYDEDGPTAAAVERERVAAERYDELNRVAARRVLSLLGAGELESMTIAENRADASDIVRTLDTGGVSTIGQATLGLDRDTGGSWLPSWLPDRILEWFGGGDTEPEPTDAAKVKDLVRRAVDSRLTLPCGISSADRTLIVLSGPPSAVSRKGFESARHWLELEADTVEVLAGDEPRPNASQLTATVVLSNVTSVDRIDELQKRAVDAIEDLESTHEETKAAAEDEFIW